jgi:hypothetical protein
VEVIPSPCTRKSSTTSKSRLSAIIWKRIFLNISRSKQTQQHHPRRRRASSVVWWSVIGDEGWPCPWLCSETVTVVPVAPSSASAAIATVGNATAAKRADEKPGGNSYERPIDVTSGPTHFRAFAENGPKRCIV